jgi:hypothetical protein
MSDNHARRRVNRLIANGVMPKDLVHDERALDRIRQAMVQSTELLSGL